jgi:hypothetical protein
MPSLFKEFTLIYEEFRKKFPNHPLTEELNTKLSRGKFPSDQWLQTRIAKMNHLMYPMWLGRKSPDRPETEH